MVRIKIILNKILNYFLKREKIKTIYENKDKYISDKGDYENNDILDQLYESNTYD